MFDVVTPALADNEQWMAIDSEATVELNTRDPLVCELRDLHLLRAVVDAILGSRETLEQGISIAAVRAPLLVEVEPAGGVLLTIGNESLADEVRAVAEGCMEWLIAETMNEDDGQVATRDLRRADAPNARSAGHVVAASRFDRSWASSLAALRDSGSSDRADRASQRSLAFRSFQPQWPARGRRSRRPGTG